jgi:hypothetical protein
MVIRYARRVSVKFFSRVKEAVVGSRFRRTAKWIGVTCASVLVIALFVRFVVAIRAAQSLQNSAQLSCSFTINANAPEVSYVQFTLKQQEVEPAFVGGAFISLGKVTTGPEYVQLVLSGSRGYGNSSFFLQLHRDSLADVFWSGVDTPVDFIRTSGSHRDFPFDSAAFDFEVSFAPVVPLKYVFLRNTNASFYIPCSTVAVTGNAASGHFHLKFEARRNPLVFETTLFLMIAASIFALIIPFSATKETVATSIASFFFSIWSVRGILGSEMTTFPTIFDLVLLALCTFILLVLSLRLIYEWAKKKEPHREA